MWEIILQLEKQTEGIHWFRWQDQVTEAKNKIEAVDVGIQKDHIHESVPTLLKRLPDNKKLGEEEKQLQDADIENLLEYTAKRH